MPWKSWINCDKVALSHYFLPGGLSVAFPLFHRPWSLSRIAWGSVIGTWKLQTLHLWIFLKILEMCRADEEGFRVFRGSRLLISRCDKRFKEAQFYAQRWYQQLVGIHKQPVPSGVPPSQELESSAATQHLVVHRELLGFPKAQGAWKLDKTGLENHQEWRPGRSYHTFKSFPGIVVFRAPKWKMATFYTFRTNAGRK